MTCLCKEKENDIKPVRRIFCVCFVEHNYEDHVFKWLRQPSIYFIFLVIKVYIWVDRCLFLVYVGYIFYKFPLSLFSHFKSNIFFQILFQQMKVFSVFATTFQLEKNWESDWLKCHYHNISTNQNKSLVVHWLYLKVVSPSPGTLFVLFSNLQEPHAASIINNVFFLYFYMNHTIITWNESIKSRCQHQYTFVQMQIKSFVYLYTV